MKKRSRRPAAFIRAARAVVTIASAATQGALNGSAREANKVSDADETDTDETR